MTTGNTGIPTLYGGSNTGPASKRSSKASGWQTTYEPFHG
jgi:hypothetical protein